MKEALRRWASQTLMWCCWVSSDTRSTLHGCFRARSFEKKAMSRMAGLLVDGEGRRDSSGSRRFSGGNREEGRGRGVWGAGTGATGPAPQGVELEKSQELTFSLRTDPIGMLKYNPQAWIFTHCKAGRTLALFHVAAHFLRLPKRCPIATAVFAHPKEHGIDAAVLLAGGQALGGAARPALPPRDNARFEALNNLGRDKLVDVHGVPPGFARSLFPGIFFPRSGGGFHPPLNPPPISGEKR